MKDSIKVVVAWIEKWYMKIKAKVHFANQIKGVIESAERKPYLFGKANKDYIKSAVIFYKTFGVQLNPDWHLAYAYANGLKSEKYIPNDLWFGGLLKFLNRQEFARAYSNKNIYDKLLDLPMPVTVARKMNGLIFSKDYQHMTGLDLKEILDAYFIEGKKLLVKPAIDTRGGMGIKVFENSFEIIEYIGDFEDVIIQPYLEQHDSLSRLNKSSVNTLRILTYLDGDEVIVLSAYLRVGSVGSLVDNMELGGVSIGIDQDGRLKSRCFGKNLNMNERVIPGTDINFSGVKIPSYDDILVHCKDQHLKFPWFRVLSWDVAIDHDSRPIFLEYNIASQGIFGHQLSNGPLFGDLTEEILTEYKNSL